MQKRYPQNFLVRRPVNGALVLFIFLFIFVMVYRPLQLSSARSFSFIFTIFLYSLVLLVPVLVLSTIIKRTNCFSKSKVWTVSKELLSVLIILLGIGVSAYFAGFIIEEPVPRWNFPTFFDSLITASLVAMIPVLFFSLLNIRYLLTPEIFQEFRKDHDFINSAAQEELIHIQSKAKKEELSFYPEQFHYAESKGNYVVFHLRDQEKPRDVMIRNSISEVEQQLSVVPHFMRIHRAFIVNLRKVDSKRGNSLGYRLKLSGSDEDLPVSRQNTQKFDQQIKKYL